MRTYYPGAEEVCDSCDNQVIIVREGETQLMCSVLPWLTTKLDWHCMKEDE